MLFWSSILTSVSGLWRHHEMYRNKWRKDHLNVRKERLDCMLVSLIRVPELFAMLFVIRNRWNINLVAIHWLKSRCIIKFNDFVWETAGINPKVYIESIRIHSCYSFLMQWTVPRSLMRLSLIKLFDFDKVKVPWRKRTTWESTWTLKQRL